MLEGVGFIDSICCGSFYVGSGGRIMFVSMSRCRLVLSGTRIN